MQLKFNLNQTIESEIFYGSYTIYILGGHYIETNPDFYIEIINIDTNKSIELTEKNLKARDCKFGRKAIKFYTFEIVEYANVRISVHNYEDIIIKDSMLAKFPFPFSLPYILISFLFGKSRKNKLTNALEILIE
jgi:hypothetical protein